jgi:hypothetical protein
MTFQPGKNPPGSAASRRPVTAVSVQDFRPPNDRDESIKRLDRGEEGAVCEYLINVLIVANLSE